MRATGSRLRVMYCVPYQTMRLAGGPTELNDRFASRLAAFFRDQGLAYEVSHLDTMAVAIERVPVRPRMIMLGCQACEWRDRDPTVTYTLEAIDFARGIIPVDGQDCLPRGDEFLVMFDALAQLVTDWPEIIGR
jgi:hypothetical protein